MQGQSRWIPKPACAASPRMPGNASSATAARLEWILDQYKAKKQKDPTIREKFDIYRFAEYQEKVIDLLARVTTVSVETVRISQAMRTSVRGTSP